MKILKLLLASILVGLGVGVTFVVFEGGLQHAIDYVWFDVFDTNNNRGWMVVLTFVGTMAFFGTQHFLDRKSEKKETTPDPTLSSFVKILIIGFFSLFAGASLGPEGILIPACIILGHLAGRAVYSDKKHIGLLTVVAFAALFTAFFTAIWAGILGLYLALQSSKTKISPRLLIYSLVGSVVTLVTLHFLQTDSYLAAPEHTANVTILTALLLVGLFGAGFAYTYALKYVFKLIEKMQKYALKQDWYKRAFIAATGLSLLYLVGGDLTQFTGNESIQPLFAEAVELGLKGLAFVAVVKIAAIAWSKSIGFRGGMIFPSVLVIAAVVAMVRLYTNDIPIEAGIIVMLAGAIAANRRTHTLF